MRKYELLLELIVFLKQEAPAIVAWLEPTNGGLVNWDRKYKEVTTELNDTFDLVEVSEDWFSSVRVSGVLEGEEEQQIQLMDEIGSAEAGDKLDWTANEISTRFNEIHEAVRELKGLFNSEANGFTLRLFDWLESVDNFVLNDNAECALASMIATAKRTCKSRLQMLQALEG